MGVNNFNIMSLNKARLIEPEKVGYEDSIDIIREELQKTRKSFIKIGWYLKHIHDNKFYEQGGYANIYEFAMEIFRFSQPTTTRYIKLCKEFSINHNSPELDQKYEDYNISQLFEMLSMKQDQIEQVSPEMTVTEIREIKRPSKNIIQKFYDSFVKDTEFATSREGLKQHLVDKLGKSCSGGSHGGLKYICSRKGIKLNGSSEITWASLVKEINELIPLQEKNENIPRQTSIESDFPQYMPDNNLVIEEKEETIIDGECREINEPEKVATSQYAKPGEREREYLNAFARKFIECERDWLIKDYANRVLDVTKSPVEIKNHLGKNCRTWSFRSGTEVAHINLFDDCIQVWAGNGECLGDFEWFYLAAAIQSMWNEAVLENAVKNRQIEEASKKDEIEESAEKIPLENNISAVGHILEQEKEQTVNPDPLPEGNIAVTRYILEQEKAQLDDILKVDKVEKLPEMMVLRQKTIVGALAAMVCDLESTDIEIEEPMQPELPVLKNNDQRKNWLEDYKTWGLWYRDEHIGAEFYKYDFSDGTRLIAETYPAGYGTSAFYHLVGGPKIRKATGKYGIPKYPHHDVYSRYPDSVTEIVEFLKVVPKGEN